MTPVSILERVSVLMAMAAVAVPSTPTMMRAVTNEDFIPQEYEMWDTKEPPENPRLVQDFRGALSPYSPPESSFLDIAVAIGGAIGVGVVCARSLAGSRRACRGSGTIVHFKAF